MTDVPDGGKEEVTNHVKLAFTVNVGAISGINNMPFCKPIESQNAKYSIIALLFGYDTVPVRFAAGW